jgi:hypothetical protein
LKSELRLARLTVVLSLSAPYALRQLCSADIAAAPPPLRRACPVVWCRPSPRARFAPSPVWRRFWLREISAAGSRYTTWPANLPPTNRLAKWRLKRARSSPSTPVEVLRRVIEREGAFRDSLIFFPTLLRLYKYNTGLSLLDYKGARQQISSMSVPTPQSSWVPVC